MVDPPSETEVGLLATVGRMQTFAETMIVNNKRREPLDGVDPETIPVKVDLEKYLIKNVHKEKTFKQLA